MLKNNRGIALAEVAITMTIMSLILVSLIPSFAYIAKNTSSTKEKSIAYDVALQEIEKIKSLPFDSVGLLGGNPNGVVTGDKDITKDSLKLHIKIRIKWKDDPDDGLTPTDSDPRDYKKATVKVSWGNNKNVKVSTMITRQSFDQISTGGNIKVIVKNSNQEPIEDVKANITSGPSSPMYDYTDANGEILFAMLDPSVTEGDYSISVEKAGYVVHPTMTNLTTSVSTNETRVLEFTMDTPGHLNVTLIDDISEQVINEPSHLTLNFSGTTVELDSNDGNFSTQDLFPGLWEVTGSSTSHEESQPQTVQIERDITNNLTIRLVKLTMGNLHLRSYDDYNGQLLPDCDVEITNMYTGEIINTITDNNGKLNIQLALGTYSIKVSKVDYDFQTVTVYVNQQDVNKDVYLPRTVVKGSILVKTMKRNKHPRAGVLVRVVGPGGYDQQLTTDNNGEALFSNLDAGNYKVYRWSWGWRHRRSVTVTNGNQVIVKYKY